jgi:hypothetical protein
MTKYLLIVYMCSMLSGQCPSSQITGYEFNSHSQCVETGYRVANDTFKNLKSLENMNEEYVENSRIIIRFDCRAVEIPQDKKIVPPKKPKLDT